MPKRKRGFYSMSHSPTLLERLGELPRLREVELLEPELLNDTVNHYDLSVLWELKDMVESVKAPSSSVDSTELLDRALLQENIRAPFRAQAEPLYPEWDCPCGKDYCHYVEARAEALDMYARIN